MGAAAPAAAAADDELVLLEDILDNCSDERCWAAIPSCGGL